jgi:polar amino acid transport system permease protein
VVTALAVAAVVAFWTATGSTPAVITHLWKWLPVLLRGLLVNIEISVLAMAIGTVVGLVIGALSLSPSKALRTATRWYVQVFRNAPCWC